MSASTPSYLDDPRRPADKTARTPRVGPRMLVLVIVTCMLVTFAVAAFIVSLVIGGPAARIESTQRRLLYATSPSAVKDASVEMWARQSKYRHDVSYQPVTDGDFSHPDPSDPALPAFIHQLEPRYITIRNGWINFEFGSRYYHYGLSVDAVSTTRPALPPPVATRELAPGVWYYAEDGKIPKQQ